MEELEIIEIKREKDGSVSLCVNGNKIDLKNTLGIHLDVRYDSDNAIIELKTVNRVCMLNFGCRMDSLK